MKINQRLLRFISPETPGELKLKAATRALEEAIEPNDEVTVLFVLSFDKDPEVAGAAKKSFDGLPAALLLEALDKKLDPLVIKRIISNHRDDEAVLVFAALNEGIDDETLKALAETGPEEIIALIEEDRDWLCRKPFLAESVRKNPLAPPSLLRALDEPEARPRRPAPKAPAEDKLNVPKELVDDRNFDEKNIYKILQNMSMGQKIKLALSGNKSAREVLIKDSNKIISISVLKNPRITEEEVLKLTSSKGTPEDLLRQVARNKEWVKNYNVKVGMATNPKTPLTISVKLLDNLFEKDLTRIARSKNIPSVLASTARRKLDAKAKK